MVTDNLSFLMENKTTKNTHLEHLEDEMFNRGMSGVNTSYRFLLSLRNMLSGNSSLDMHITTKWDGAPSVLAGINPENGKFFVSTKSALSSTPKLNYTEGDIVANHDSLELREKLKACLRYLPKLGIRNILQGDVLFTEGDVTEQTIHGVVYQTFTPNTLTYVIPSGTPLAKKIQSAKLGIVFHTEYKGKTMQDLVPSFNIHIGYLNQHKDVWFRDSTFVDMSGVVTFTSDETKEMDRTLKEINELRERINSSLLNQLSINERYRSYIKMFNNCAVRDGNKIDNTITYTNVFIRWVDERLAARVLEAKRKETKQKRIQERVISVRFLKQYNADLKLIFDLYKLIIRAKMMVLDKLFLAENNNLSKIFLKTESGYKVTSPEGFVAVDKMGNVIKLVDRLEFSRANFRVARQWR